MQVIQSHDFAGHYHALLPDLLAVAPCCPLTPAKAFLGTLSHYLMLTQRMRHAICRSLTLTPNSENNIRPVVGQHGFCQLLTVYVLDLRIRLVARHNPQAFFSASRQTGT